MVVMEKKRKKRFKGNESVVDFSFAVLELGIVTLLPGHPRFILVLQGSVGRKVDFHDAFLDVHENFQGFVQNVR